MVGDEIVYSGTEAHTNIAWNHMGDVDRAGDSPDQVHHEDRVHRPLWELRVRITIFEIRLGTTGRQTQGRAGSMVNPIALSGPMSTAQPLP